MGGGGGGDCNYLVAFGKSFPKLSLSRIGNISFSKKAGRV